MRQAAPSTGAVVALAVTSPPFDYIIAGAGGAGLSLALHLAASPLRDRRLLLIDQHLNRPAEHDWAFWAERPTLLDDLVRRSWRRLRVATSRSERVLCARRYRYAVLDSACVREYTLSRLAGLPGAACLEGRIERVVDGPASASVLLADNRSYDGRWVFDSRCEPAALGTSMWQSFAGWEIEAEGGELAEGLPMLMDFRTPQEAMVRFVYVLPLSERRALVEHVTCGPSRSSLATQESALATYIERVLHVPRFRLVRREGGVSPLSVSPRPRQVGRRVMTIGIPGGRVKASTGYAWMRIQRDSAAIVRSLQRRGHPFAVPTDSWRHRRYDAVLLELMRQQPERVEAVFEALFAGNPLDRIFRFLDEATGLADEARLAATLPAWFWGRAIDPRRLERSRSRPRLQP